MVWSNSTSNQAPRGGQAFNHVDFKFAIIALKILKGLRSKVTGRTSAYDRDAQ
jgi:hypothetical protein